MLDQSNITYFIAQIRKQDFEKLDFFVTPTTPASIIPKTIIFVNNINTAGKLVIYLQSRLSARLCKKANMLIQIFLTNLTVKIRTQFLEDFCNSDTCIWLCIKCAGIDLNLCNI